MSIPPGVELGASKIDIVTPRLLQKAPIFLDR